MPNFPSLDVVLDDFVAPPRGEELLVVASLIQTMEGKKVDVVHLQEGEALLELLDELFVRVLRVDLRLDENILPLPFCLFEDLLKSLPHLDLAAAVPPRSLEVIDPHLQRPQDSPLEVGLAGLLDHGLRGHRLRPSLLVPHAPIGNDADVKSRLAKSNARNLNIHNISATNPKLGIKITEDSVGASILIQTVNGRVNDTVGLVHPSHENWIRPIPIGCVSCKIGEIRRITLEVSSNHGEGIL
mmetsp:Transcript_18822/g.39173  ORF Transcript_18822/g.39173 Transcript_18822/m.39173 type:complete len:242 (-) Transcript_18822:214-939(-)